MINENIFIFHHNFSFYLFKSFYLSAYHHRFEENQNSVPVLFPESLPVSCLLLRSLTFDETVVKMPTWQYKIILHKKQWILSCQLAINRPEKINPNIAFFTLIPWSLAFTEALSELCCLWIKKRKPLLTWMQTNPHHFTLAANWSVFKLLWQLAC